MKWSELTRKLSKNGWYFHRQGRGSHEIWRHSDSTEEIIVCQHKSQEVGTGLEKQIKKQAGLK